MGLCWDAMGHYGPDWDIMGTFWGPLGVLKGSLGGALGGIWEASDMGVEGGVRDAME